MGQERCLTITLASELRSGAGIERQERQHAEHAKAKGEEDLRGRDPCVATCLLFMSTRKECGPLVQGVVLLLQV